MRAMSLECSFYTVRAVSGDTRLNRARVLVADDHPVVLNSLGALLSLSFEVVGTVANGEEMISAGMRLDPDVIVTDIAMPGLNGVEVAHRLYEAGSRANIVFLTIHVEREFIDECVAKRVLGYVMKSRMKTDLIPAINAALNGRIFISPLGSR